MSHSASRNQGSKSRGWSNPAIIAAVIGGVFVVAAAFVPLFFGGGSHGSTMPPVTSRSAAPRSSESSGSSEGTPINSTPATSFSVYWKGSVTLTSSNIGLNFDTKPPTPENSPAVIWYGSFELSPAGTPPNSAQLALWNQSRSPTPAQCEEWVPTHVSQNVTIATGAQICFKTLQGRYGLLQITSVSYLQMGAFATVWNH